jgi:hypothetical protein
MSKRKRKGTAGAETAATPEITAVTGALNELVFRRPELERDIFTIARKNGLGDVSAYIQRMRRYRKASTAAYPTAAAKDGSS